MTINSKWETLLEYIVNDESDKARGLFHEIVVAESRSIYADILESDVDESMNDEEVDGNEVEGFIDEVEADEFGDNTVEDAGEEVEDSMEVSDDDAGDEDSMDDMGDEADMDDMGDDDGMGDEMGDDAGEEGEEVEDRVADLENALDELKAEFDQLMSQEQDEPEHAEMGMDTDDGEMDMSNSDDMSNELDEYSLSEGVEMSKVAAVSNSESGVNSKSIVAKKNDFGGKAVKFDQGGDETGGKVSAPEKKMGRDKYANSVGHKNVKMDNATKAQMKEPAGVMSKPILGK